MTTTPRLRKALPGGRWETVERLEYKPEGSAPFRDITRQLLFRSDGLGCELRYFEIGPGGHSTLERHQHEHAVLILNGSGRCLVGDTVHTVTRNDLIAIPSMSWHQFRAAEETALGFLCMVNAERDRPQLPTDSELNDMRKHPDLAAFIRS